MIRSFFLAAAMNLVPAAPLDILRFLRVPPIVWVLRRRVSSPSGWKCRRSLCGGVAAYRRR
jgi:hypothetical protein